MSKSFCITIDTEPDCTTKWKRSDPLTFESVLMGIPQLLRPIWNHYNIKPVYFVSPEVVKNKQCCEVLKKEIQLGAEIGTHLHSEYIEPEIKHKNADGTNSKEYPCFAHDDDVEYEKIKNLSDLINNNIGIKPISYRAARYGADLATIQSLNKLGYKIDSSVTPHLDWSPIGGPDHSCGPEQPYFIDHNNYYKQGNMNLLEVPITISGKRLPFLPNKWLFYRWLRPSHMTVFEMKRLIRTFIKKYENPELNMMFHSMEIIPGKSPFTRTKVEQKLLIRRLTKTIEQLLKKDFKNKTLEEIYNEKLREI